MRDVCLDARIGCARCCSKGLRIGLWVGRRTAARSPAGRRAERSEARRTVGTSRLFGSCRQHELFTWTPFNVDGDERMLPDATEHSRDSENELRLGRCQLGIVGLTLKRSPIRNCVAMQSEVAT